MASESVRRLIAIAAAERVRLRRHLLMAAALREILGEDAVVVGGTAEEFWTADEYHPTDLDICAPIAAGAKARLRAHGFEREGRHWFHPQVNVAIEFPDDRIDGDMERVVDVAIARGSARMIGLDDLYLDRLRQATMIEGREGVEFLSALAVAAARMDAFDTRYLARRLSAIEGSEPEIGSAMRRIDRRIRARVRRRL